MVAALLLLVIFTAAVWLIFFKLKLLKFSIAWGIVCALFGIHILLIFVIGLRFSTPYSTDARVIQHTIQLIPRLPEPTLVTAVLVKPDVPVKKGDPLFQFDRRPYEYQVRQMEGALAAAQDGMAAAEYKIKQLQAGLVAAKQDVLVRKVDVEAADAKVEKLKSEAEYAQYQYGLYHGLAEQGAGPVEDSEKWSAQVKVQEASVKEAEADAKRSKLIYESQVNGVNTNVVKAIAELKEEEAAVKQAEATAASVSGQLALARYYLENTTMVAPEDGHIVNLQVVPGMVSGIVRFGAIASFIVDKDSYVLANFFQEHLKYVKTGQTVEVALNRYPGQIFQGKVESVWWANGEGQLLPTGDLPVFNPGPNTAQTGFAVKIAMENKNQGLFPIGAQGAAAIYTSNGGFAAMRRIVIRTYSWFNFLYPMPSA
jgi:multidrug resistance efflux pump